MAVNQGIDIQAMRDVVNAARTKFMEGFVETQEIRSFKLQKMVLDRAISDTPEHGYEWALRIKSAQGSTQMLDSYESVSYSRDTYDTSCKVTPRTLTTHTNMWIDRLAQMFNQGAQTKIYKAVEMKESAAIEEAAKTWESKFLNPPQTVSAKDGFLGMLYHYRRSATSGGVFTELLTPARNGVYYRDGSGAWCSDMYNVSDISAAAYARLRTLVGTHRGVMDAVLLNTVKLCVRDSGFEYIDELKGDKTKQDLVILWDEAFESDYDDLCKSLGAPLRRDFFASGDTTVKGVATVGIPSFKNHFLRPIIGWNRNELKFRKLRGGWDQQGEEKIGHNGMAFPIDNTGQFWAQNPSSHGFMVHGSFSTGT